MLLYPYIQGYTISYGKTAEILGVHELDVISSYGKMRMVDTQKSSEELDNDIQAIMKARGQLDDCYF